MQTLYVVQYMSLNVVQSAVEQRQTAQYGWSVVKQATLQQFLSVSGCYSGQNKLSYHREIQNVTMYSTHHYNLLCFFFSLFSF